MVETGYSIHSLCELFYRDMLRDVIVMNDVGEKKKKNARRSSLWVSLGEFGLQFRKNPFQVLDTTPQRHVLGL
eukprot:m.111211 g.111211  ORF g.111211 m.111211 type:complete len:73 (+) comp16999_c0_seq1:114-332(+)